MRRSSLTRCRDEADLGSRGAITRQPKIVRSHHSLERSESVADGYAISSGSLSVGRKVYAELRDLRGQRLEGVHYGAQGIGHACHSDAGISLATMFATVTI
jgi:hypothetical protein